MKENTEREPGDDPRLYLAARKGKNRKQRRKDAAWGRSRAGQKAIQDFYKKKAAEIKKVSK